MGKVVKYTGSRLLGEELRRMRGARSLDDIVGLSKQSPLTARIHPVSAPSLSQIENGITMPSTEVLYTLSVLYNVSPARLLNFVVEERIAATTELPATPDEAKIRLRADMGEGRWFDALAITIAEVTRSCTQAERVYWNVQRAWAMRKLGLRSDAILLLIECAESPHIAREHVYVAHLYLAEALAEAGHVKSAIDNTRRASELLPEGTAPDVRGRVLLAQVRLAILHHAFGHERNERMLRDALRWIAEIRASTQPLAKVTELLLKLDEAIIQQYLGNSLVAGRDMEATAREAEAAHETLAEIYSWLNLGRLRRLKGRIAEARVALERAEARLDSSLHFDEAFDVHFELYQLESAARGKRLEYHRKRCLRFWPLTQSRTPNVTAFEEGLRLGGVR